LRFDKKINPEKISKGLLVGLVLANCVFCRWGVKFEIRSISAQTAWVDLRPFNGDEIYADSCIKEMKDFLPSCYSTKIMDNKALLIRFNDDMATIGQHYK
jgi:hypothetical protein